MLVRRLERKIIGTPVHTPLGLTAKQRIIAVAGFEREDLATIMLEAEAERVAVAAL